MRQPSRHLLLAAVLGGAVLCGAVLPTHAQDRSAVVRLLRDGRDFRVRTQAAFALGSTGDTAMRPHLERALRTDREPSVRAAAATALGRLRSRDALPALRRARNDSSPAVRAQVERAIRDLNSPQPDSASTHAASTPSPSGTTPPPSGSGGFYPRISVLPDEGSVRWAQVRYVLIAGEFTNRSGFEPEYLSGLFRERVEHNARGLQRVAVFRHDQQIPADAVREISRRRLPKMRIDGNLVSVERRTQSGELSVRCEVSLVLLDEPQRTMRGMLRGAATGSAPRRGNPRSQERSLAAQALDGAVTSAMSSVPEALARAVQARR